MSLMGIDVGTTGCKVVCFSMTGEPLAAAYREHDIQHPEPGWAELDAAVVWRNVQDAIREVAQAVKDDPIRALAVSSLGEAVVPVTRDRCILGPSILNFDVRGASYVEPLSRFLDDSRLYGINGNTLGNHYGLTKLCWIRDHRPRLYEAADKFLLWSGFIAFMLGAEPAVDYSLANRTLLFDLQQEDWSDTLLAWGGVDRDKLPVVVPSGTAIGHVSPAIAAELGLPPNVVIVAGAHDQCANAVGCGVIEEGLAVYGMGTFLCITPVFSQHIAPSLMIPRGLNTEHHAVPGKYVTFIYNQGGSLVKWYRDTFAREEHRQAQAAGEDVYDHLFAELPEGPSGVMVLPHFTTTGPPEFVSDSVGVIAGLHLETPRGAILKGILEGATFYLRECLEALPETGIRVRGFRATGGGSKSDAWIQLSANILGQPFLRPRVTEAGALGAAIMAGVGCGALDSFTSGVAEMVKLEHHFEPDPRMHAAYAEWYARYRELWPLMRGYLHDLASG